MSTWRFPVSYTPEGRIGGSAEALASVTAGAGAWGAWTSLGGSFSRDVDLIEVSAQNDSVSARAFYLSLAVGSGADANIIVDGLFATEPLGLQWPDTHVWRLPVRVPAGATLFAKTAALSAVTQKVAVVGYAGGAHAPAPFSRIEAISAVNPATIVPPAQTAVVGGGTTWVEHVASTARRYGALMLRMDTTASAVNRQFSARVAIGSAASESLLMLDRFASRNNNAVSGDAGFVEMDVPPASRLSVAVNGTAAETVRVHIIGAVA